MLWILKIFLLLVGYFVPVFGAILLFLDGIFHATTPLKELVQNSPDWIIARNLFQKKGLKEIIHKIMGYFLILSTLPHFLQITNKPLYFEIIYPIFFSLLTAALLIKKQGKVAFM